MITKPKTTRGGKRPGAGRPKGSRNANAKHWPKFSTCISPENEAYMDKLVRKNNGFLTKTKIVDEALGLYRKKHPLR